MRKEFEQRLIRFTVDILKLADTIRTKTVLQPVANQVVRSAGSIGANAIEAKASASRKEYTYFMQVALKSANETAYWLEVIESYEDSPRSSVVALLKEVRELANILGASVRTLKSQ